MQLPLHHMHLVARDALEDGVYGLTVLPLDDDKHGVQGRCWAYVSLVDNITWDPTNRW